MSNFSIDEVSASFKADVGLFLTRIQQGAQAALDAPALQQATLGPDLRPAFSPLGDLGHAIYGTSALIGAESLHESARMLEELAHAGEEALAQMEALAARARAIATACAEGVNAMRQMLLLELDHRGVTAMVLARTWIESAEHLRRRNGESRAPTGGPAAAGASGSGETVRWGVPAPSSVSSVDEAWSEESSAQESSAQESSAGSNGEDSVGADFFQLGSGPESVLEEPEELTSESQFQFEGRAEPFGGELLDIFRSEGRDTVRALDATLARLRAQPGDMTAVAKLERLYHTLKGAASIVGLDEVSRAAAGLQEKLEEPLERGSTLDAQAIAGLVRETDDMLARAGLPALAPAGAALDAGADSVAGDAAHRFFLEEVVEIQREALALIDELGSSADETALRARVEIGKLFHRMKGSALLVGETQVGEDAEKMERWIGAEATATVTGDDVGHRARAAFQRIATQLGTEPPAGPASAPPPAALAPVRWPVTVAADAELWDAFVQESRELLDRLERESLALEGSAQPRQVLEAIMNLVHTLKGVLNTVGLAPTAEGLHRVEDLVEQFIKAPILPPMRQVANLLLHSKAEVEKNLVQARHGYVETSAALLEERITKLLVAVRGGAPSNGRSGAASGAERTGASVHRIDEARSARRSAPKPAGSGAPPESREVASAADPADRKFIRVGTERLDSLMNLAGELVVSRSRLLERVGTLRHLQRELGRGSLRLVDAVDQFRDTYEYFNIDGRGPAAARPAVEADPAEGWEGFGELELDRYEDVHILSRRLAEIVSDVTELSSQLSRSLTTFNDDSQVFDSIVTGIQSEVTRARMVPLDLLFSRLRLPVRDAAAREQKEVQVVTEGAEVSIDKTIADGLFGPMLHLVRNAVVHGIEAPGARERADKPAVGTITLAARQESGQIVIEVRDDGAGLDLAALRAAGTRLHLVAENTPLDDAAIKDLVFAPGLTTQEQADSVAGRGVGCDVVRRAVERMNGTIQVDTEKGRGAGFIITLPVTLAISKALLVRSNQRVYALPLHFAERILDAASETIIESAGSRRIKVDDAFIGVSHLEHDLTGADAGGTGPVLLLRVGEQREALQVDAVIGQEEIVVKSLGDILAGHPMFAGVTMRGSGQLVLILDVPGLLEAKSRRRRRVALSRPDARPARPRAAGEAPAPVPARRSRTRVLFVDDSLSVRKYAEMTFASLGVDVTLAVDGIDALARLRSERFDLVFTDLEMPRMHGFELIRELRFVPAYRDLPIVVVTSRSGQKHKQHARALGASEYLTKPFSAEVVAEVLRRFARAGEAEVRPTPRGLWPS